MKPRFAQLLLVVLLLMTACTEVRRADVNATVPPRSILLLTPTPEPALESSGLQGELQFVEAVQSDNFLSPVRYVYRLIYQNAAEGFVLVSGTENITGLSAFLSSGQTIEVPVAPGVSRPVVIYFTDGKENLVFNFNVSASEWPERVYPSISSIPFDLEVVNQIQGGSGSLLELQQLLVQFPERLKPFISEVKGDPATGCDGMTFDWNGDARKGGVVWLNFAIDLELRPGSSAEFRTLLVEPWVVNLDEYLSGYDGPPGFSIQYAPGYAGRSLLYAEVRDADGVVYAKCKVLLEIAE